MGLLPKGLIVVETLHELIVVKTWDSLCESSYF